MNAYDCAVNRISCPGCCVNAYDCGVNRARMLRMLCECSYLRSEQGKVVQDDV